MAMDLLDRLLGHDAWTTDLLLEICADLDDDALDHRFGIGPGTLRATLAHIVRNEEAWTASMTGRDKPTGSDDTIQGLTQRHAAAASAFAAFARQVRGQGAWDDTWIDSADGIRRTYGGAIAHLMTHSMHHRGQVLFMLRRLGVAGIPEGDVLSWEQWWRGSGQSPDAPSSPA